MYVKVYPRLLQKQARVDRYDLEMDVEHQTLELRKMNNCACNQLWSEFNTEMFVLHPVILDKYPFRESIICRFSLKMLNKRCPAINSGNSSGGRSMYTVLYLCCTFISRHMLRDYV